MSALDDANLLAAHAVAYATAYLDGRHTAATLADHAQRLQLDLLAAHESAILDPVRVLNGAMMHTARADLDKQDSARVARWCQVMGALVDLVIAESRLLAQSLIQGDAS